MFVVTGANGFIGSVLVHDLNRQGFTDLLLSDYISPEERPELLATATFSHFFHPDELVEKLGDYSNISAIFHIGACSSTTETNWDYLEKVNLKYTQSLWNYCSENAIDFLYASSAATYGDGSLGFSDKTDPQKLHALNLYGRSKLEFDQWALEQKNSPPRWYGFRFFNVFGPNEYFKNSMASVAYKAYTEIRETGRLKLFKSHRPDYEDGMQLRDFVYVKDVTRWCFEYYERRTVPSGIYNLGSGKARSWLDLAKSIFPALDRKLDIQWIDIPENIRHQYQYFTEADMTKHLEEKLSPPEWDLEGAIDDYIHNYLRQPKTFYG